MLGGILAGIVATVAGGLLVYLVQRLMADRVSIKRLRSPTDSHLQGLIDLYRELFPEEEGTNYSTEEIIGFLNARPAETHHVEVENIILTAVLAHEVVGFIFCHLYPDKRKAIISYFGIDREVKGVRRRRAQRVLKKLRTILKRGNRCDLLFFDLDESAPRKGRSDSRTLRVVFLNSARSFRLDARELKFPYRCPRVSMSQGAHEHPCSLFCIGVRDRLPANVSKQQMLEYLEFIYLDCYGDIYPMDDSRFKDHQTYLRELLKQYENTLPEVVPAV